MGQKGTFIPSSWDTANANAVLPVPGAPTSKSARPENLRDFIKSTTTPQAYKSNVSISFHNLRAQNVPLVRSFDLRTRQCPHWQIPQR